MGMLSFQPFVTLFASRSQVRFRADLYIYFYVDMYDIFYYYTRRIDMSIFWVTRYVLVCGRFNPICGRCVVTNMVSDNVQKGGVPKR